jgi:WD40 repeat protein
LLNTVNLMNVPNKFLFLDNRTVVVGFKKPIIRILDITIKAEIGLLSGHTKGVLTLLQLKDETTIASGSADRTIKVWNYTNVRLLKDIPAAHDNDVTGLVLLSNGNLASCSVDRTIKVWNVSGHNETLLVNVLLGHESIILCIELLGKDLLASGSWDRTIRLWNVSSGREIKAITSDENDVAICLILLLDRLYGQGEHLLASGEKDWTVKIWSTAAENSQQLVNRLEGHRASVLSLLNLNKTSYIASASQDATIIIWNWETCALVKTLTGHSTYVVDLSLLSNGYLASVSNDRTIRVWNLPVIFKYPNRSNLIPYQDW